MIITGNGGVAKIKTIGDAYLVLVGVQIVVSDHETMSTELLFEYES